MYNLTKAQRAMLEEAARLNREVYGEWFIPAKHEMALVYDTKATAKALCAKGMLEWRVFLPAIAKYYEIIEYRITEDGRAALHSCYSITVSVKE